MRDQGANASWFLLSLVVFFASPFFARSTAARAARAVFSNPLVASNNLSGKPLTSDPPGLTTDLRLRWWLPRTIRYRLGMPGVGRAIRQGDLAGAKALLACPTSCENTRLTRGRPPPRRLGGLAFAPTTITGQWAWRRSEEHTSELQSHSDLVCRLLLEKKKNRTESTQEEKNTKITKATQTAI